METFATQPKDPSTLFCVLVGCFVFIVVLSYVGPHALRYSTLKQSGDTYLAVTEEADLDTMNVHAARYREFVGGNFFPGEIDTLEHKGTISWWPLLSGLVLAPFFYFSGSLNGGIILTDLLFPLVLFYSLYRVLHALTGATYFSLIVAFFAMLFPRLFLVLPPSSLRELMVLIQQFVPFFVDEFSNSSMFLRREAFIPAAPFFVGTLLAQLLLLVRKVPSATLVIVSGLLYGSLFYLYFYYWVFATIVIGLLFLRFIFSDRQKAYNIALSFVVGLIISIPYWTTQYQLSQIPHYSEVIARMGLEIGHGVRWALWKTYALFAVLGCVAIWLKRFSSIGVRADYVAILALTSILAVNANVVTGVMPQADHWGGRVYVITNIFLFSTVFYFLFQTLVSRYQFKKVQIFSKIILLLLTIGLSTHTLYSAYINNIKYAHEFTISKNVLEAYEWLNSSTPSNSVVLTPDRVTNIEIPAYTNNRIYLARSQTTIASEDEILERLYSGYRLLGIKKEIVEGNLNEQYWVLNLFTEKYAPTGIYAHLRPDIHKTQVLPDTVIERVLQEFEAYQLTEVPYQLDYIFIGPREKEMEISLDRLHSIDVVYENESVTIYEYRDL